MNRYNLKNKLRKEEKVGEIQLMRQRCKIVKMPRQHKINHAVLN